jgi:UDP-glucose 4-epimerase
MSHPISSESGLPASVDAFRTAPSTSVRPVVGAPELTTVLVTGGAGFIGSHTCVELLNAGYSVVVADNYSNSSRAALDRVEALTGCEFAGVYTVDLRDRAALSTVFDLHAIDAVIHFAAKKAVRESVAMPLEYYDINVTSTTNLLSEMVAHDVDKLVFSSSCSIYGATAKVPLDETDPPAPTNPYARSKWVCEQILTDACTRYPDLRVIALRYFNPAGAHASAMLGEDPTGIPNNIMPYLAQLAVGRRERLEIFGNDYATADGTCVRDYIHVVDVADGHKAALEHLDDDRGFSLFNLGTGVGTSVLELAEEFQEVCGSRLAIDIVPRRPGDVDTLIADPQKVADAWGWHAKRNVRQMCEDAWAFQQANPSGYIAVESAATR